MFFRFLQKKINDFWASKFGPIPPEFHSLETDGPFRHCLDCGGSLLFTQYLIEKIYSNGEVIYEYALCVECAKKLREELSRESKKAIKRYLRRNRTVKQTLEACTCCRLPKEELPSYQIIGQFSGEEMLNWNLPMLICEPCVDGLAEHLSKQTRDRLDGFLDEHFPGPPEMDVPLPTRSRPVLI
ncbi:MAG: hypothetical protein KDN19_06435 [Verrucomicrobiae bacterium]|nr:hypothetical protein [Verrucomicrobiae bacterium]